MTPGDKKWRAVWIQDPAFSALAPLDHEHKQLSPLPAPPHRDDLKNRRMLVRRVFSIEQVPAVARFDLTADDYFKLYVNGRYVVQGPAPAIPSHYRYLRLDLAPFLVPGENLIAVDVYYQGLRNRVWNSADHRQGLIAELFEGERLLLATDARWRFLVPAHAQGETIGYETQYLEDIDSRNWPQGWNELGFDDRSWAPCAEHPNDDHILFLQETPALDHYAVKPVSILPLEPGRLLVDFGKEWVGTLALDAYGKRGDLVEIRHGEELLPQGGGVRWELRCNCKYRERWTLSGRQPDRLDFYDYKAFRWAEILHPVGVRLADIHARVRHYPLSAKPGKEAPRSAQGFPVHAARLDASDPFLKPAWDLCAHGLMVGVQENFLDCPTREKGQYLGDLSVSGHGHFYLSGDGRPWAKALADFADSTRICPGMMAVAPGSFMQEIADFSLQYPMQLRRFFRLSGDQATARRLLPTAEGVLSYFSGYARADGLLENVQDKWNLVDWPENLRDGYDFSLDPKGPGKGPHAVLNAFYGSALEELALLRRELGLPAKEGVPHFRDSFQRAFWRPERGHFVDHEASDHASLHANALALFAGLAPQEGRNGILQLIRRKGFACGVYFSYFVMGGLARAGDRELLWELLSNTGEHSWAQMLRDGATACLEAWGKDQKWNTSFCHPWGSALLPVFIEEIAGVTPASPGFAAIGLNPWVGVSLPAYRLELDLPKAKVQIGFDGSRVEIRIHAGSDPVELHLPDSTRKGDPKPRLVRSLSPNERYIWTGEGPAGSKNG